MKKNKSIIKSSIITLGALHVLNKVIDSTSIVNTSTRTNGKYYHWKHGDIFYKTYGNKDNKPLIFIHDLTVGSSSYEWTKLAKTIGDTYRVYCIDLVGCGRSDKPAITYTNYFYVQMISDFVTEVIKEKTDVVVTGLSSSFVLMANQMNQNLFDKIMMVTPPSLSLLKRTPDDRSKLLLKLFEFPVIGKSLYYFFTSKMNLEYYLTETCYFNSFHMEPSVIKAYYDAAHSGNGNGKYLYASIQSNYLYADITKALKNAENNIMIVTGMENKEGMDIIKSYRSMNPEIVIEEISNAKLLPHLENQEEMLELLYRF